MKAQIKTSAYFTSIIALLSAVLVYMSTSSMGFPDGHLTEFELAIKPFLIGYSILALFFAFLFYGLVRFSAKTSGRVLFYISLVLFILLVLGLGMIYFNFNSNYNHGGGG
ncbi:MAG: hypothetical protein AB8B59_10270 [Maribacter sp.]